MFDKKPSPKPQLVKKFYFLDYFLILLQSCDSYKDISVIFQSFRDLKEKERLGESKYRKLIKDDSLSDNQVKRYIYTFNQVISEASNYGLIIRKNNLITLTEVGKRCLQLAGKNKRTFYNEILTLMEGKYFAFYHLINLCYDQNRANNGLLIFPIYSPRKLGLEKEKMRTGNDWYNFSILLKEKLEQDIDKYLQKKVSLEETNASLLKKLEEDSMLNKDLKALVKQENYNAILGRVRKFWLNYFLNNLYGYQFSFDTFNIWVERGKQLGIVHSTEFYPDFDGRLVFPTSIIVEDANNSDFGSLFTYENGEQLFIHTPNWEKVNNKKFEITQHGFVKSLVDSYYDLKRNRKTNFVQISDLREKVCYKMRIPSFVFNDFLEKTYNLNIKGDLQFQISLEADRLPEETSAMYLKREPVLVNNENKNIISINIK